METSGFFNAMENADGSYDRTYIAEQFAKFFSMFIGNGVFASPQNQLKVVAKENLTVTIKKGFAFIDGYWYYNDSDLDIDITPNATANKRVDGIFVTLDKTERTITHTYEVGRTNRIVNGSVSELKIAEVTVEVGVAVLSDAKIKDTRADNNVCGFVTGIIDVIETDDLFLQFETQFTEWFNSLDKEGKKILSDFITESDALLESFTNDKDEALNNFSIEINEWFESIKGKMSEEDIAVSLQLQVDDLRTDTDENTSKIGNLIKQVNLFDIIMSTDYTLPNSKRGGYRLNEMVGNTVQNGEPTPSTPIAIENTFDCVEMIQGYYNGGVFTSNANYICNKNKIPCKSGDKIKILTEVGVAFVVAFYTNGTFASQVSTSNIPTEYEATVPSGADSFTFNLNKSNITPQNVGKITLTVNGKYVGQIVMRPKNLAKFVRPLSYGKYDETTCTISTSSTDKLVNAKIQYVNNSNFISEAYDTIGAGKKVFKITKDSRFNQIAIGYHYGTYDTRILFDVSALKDGETYYVQMNVDVSNNCISGVMITTNPNYDELIEPYTEKITTFFLNEPLRKGDRLVKVDGVICENHKRATVVFDGSDDEIWSINTLNIPMVEIYIADKMNGNGLCSHYCEANINSTNENLGFSTNNANKMIRFRPSDYETITLGEWKSRLAENPITVEYELETETYTPLDTASQLALNDMETFDGVTYIKVDSKIPPTSISGEYGASEVSALSLENANLRDSEAILEKERNIVQRLSRVNLSSINGYIKAYCVDCTDIPVFDEGINEGFYEQWQNDYGINMERYTVLNESGYGNGIYTRVNSVSWQKVSGNPAAEFESRVQYVDIDFSGEKIVYSITPPSGFTIDNSVVIAYDHFVDGENQVYHNHVKGTDVLDNSTFLAQLSFMKNPTTGSFAIWTSQMDAFSEPSDLIRCEFTGMLRVYFMKVK